MLCELVRTNNVDAYRTEVRAHPDKLVKFKDVHDSGNIPYCVMNINKKKFNYTSNAGRKKQNFRYKESHLSRMNAIHMVSVLSHLFAPYPHPSAPGPLRHIAIASDKTGVAIFRGNHGLCLLPCDLKCVYPSLYPLPSACRPSSTDLQCLSLPLHLAPGGQAN